MRIPHLSLSTHQLLVIPSNYSVVDFTDGRRWILKEHLWPGLHDNRQSTYKNALRSCLTHDIHVCDLPLPKSKTIPTVYCVLSNVQNYWYQPPYCPVYLPGALLNRGPKLEGAESKARLRVPGSPLPPLIEFKVSGWLMGRSYWPLAAVCMLNQYLWEL